MSGYEEEHNISRAEPAKSSRRPDLSSFYNFYDLIDTSNEPQGRSNANALPLPGDVAIAFRTLANAFELMRGGESRVQGAAPLGRPTDAPNSDLLGQLVETLMESANDPPREVNGVPDSFLDGLDRVPKTKLKKGESCPICGIPFLDDKYPLVVVLPCHKNHRFDLDCIRPWVKLNPTCPLDRKSLIKKPAPQPVEDEEEEYDGMFA